MHAASLLAQCKGEMDEVKGRERRERDRREEGGQETGGEEGREEGKKVVQ